MTDSLRKRQDLLAQIPARAKIPVLSAERQSARADRRSRRSLKARAFARASIRFAAARLKPLPVRAEFGR
jgi:hypothetical protein